MFEKIWKFFSSLRLTFVIFFLVTVSTLVGSFIIQRPNAQQGQLERAYSPETLKLFEFFGFIDLFHSPWFVFILFLMGVNVICASIEMWPRHLALYKKQQPELSLEAMKNQAQYAEIDLQKKDEGRFLERALPLLQKSFAKPIQIFKDGVKKIHVNKMPWSHFGVYVVHVGVVIILLGGVWGSIDGYEAQMSLMEGEQTRRIYLRNKNKQNEVLPFIVKANDIRIDTYESGAPKDYFTDLSIYNLKGEEVYRKTIEVNDPLSYGGVNFYQASYGKQRINEEKFYEFVLKNRKTKKVVKIKIPEESKTAQIPGTDYFLNIEMFKQNASMPSEKGTLNLGDAVQVAFGKKSEKPTPYILFKDYPEVFDLIYKGSEYSMAFNGIQENFELVEVTGIQVAKDPGAPIVFLGCAILMLGVYWTFFTSHQKIWMVSDGTKIYVAGKAHRNPWGFKGKFENFVEGLKDLIAEENQLDSDEDHVPVEKKLKNANQPA